MTKQSRRYRGSVDSNQNQIIRETRQALPTVQGVRYEIIDTHKNHELLDLTVVLYTSPAKVVFVEVKNPDVYPAAAARPSQPWNLPASYLERSMFTDGEREFLSQQGLDMAVVFTTEDLIRTLEYYVQDLPPF